MAVDRLILMNLPLETGEATLVTRARNPVSVKPVAYEDISTSSSRDIFW